MKFLIALFFLFATLSHAAPVLNRKITASGGSPIPSSYTTGSQSLVLTELTGSVRHVAVFNNTASVVAFTVAHPSPAFAPSNDQKDYYVPPGVGLTLDEIGTSTQLFLRSDSGSTITSGTVYVQAW